MTAEFPPNDRDNSPQPDTGHDPVRIADALRRSPHFATAHANPGSNTVRFTTAEGRINYTLTLRDAEPTDNGMLLIEPIVTDVIAAAILNHPGFVRADVELPDEDVTIQTRNLVRYRLVLDVEHDNVLAEEDLSTPAFDVAFAADRLLANDPSDTERATAELLNYVAATWDKQDLPLREHAQAVARTLRTR